MKLQMLPQKFGNPSILKQINKQGYENAGATTRKCPMKGRGQM